MEYYSLAESSMTFSSLKSGNNEFIYNRAKIFRHIQLLISMLNAFQKSSLVLIIVGAPILVWVFALTSLVKSSGTDFIYLATLVMLLVDVVLIDLVVLGQMAAVHRKSYELLESIRSTYNLNLSARERKWEKRFYRSCTPLKIMINSVNFVDDFTPLNCLDMSMNTSASVLMLE